MHVNSLSGRDLMVFLGGGVGGFAVFWGEGMSWRRMHASCSSQRSGLGGT